MGKRKVLISGDKGKNGKKQKTDSKLDDILSNPKSVLSKKQVPAGILNEILVCQDIEGEIHWLAKHFEFVYVNPGNGSKPVHPDDFVNFVRNKRSKKIHNWSGI